MSTKLHMKHLPVSVALPLSLSSSGVRTARTYVCIFMKNIFNKNSFCFSNLHIVYILRFYYVYLNILFLCIFFHSCIFLSFCYKSRRISGDENPPVYTFFIFCSLHFVAQPLRSCGTAPYMPRHPLTPLPWQAAGCTSPHDRCGRALRS